MSKKVDSGQHNMDEEFVVKALIAYLQEQDQKSETHFQVFINHLRETLTHFRVELVKELRDSPTSSSKQPTSNTYPT